MLENHPTFSSLSPEQLRALISVMTKQNVRGGTVIIQEGDTLDELYVLTGGRLRVTRKGHDRAIGDLARGAVFGEMGILGDTTRTATVCAIRDSTLLVLKRADFEQLVDSNPRLLLTLCGALFQRLFDKSDAPPTVGTIAHLSPTNFNARPLLDAFDAVLRARGSVERITQDSVMRSVNATFTSGNVREDLTELLDQAEATNDTVTLDATISIGDWATRCGRSADRLVFWIRKMDATSREYIHDKLSAWDARFRPPAYVVFVHGDDVVMPSGTREFLGGLAVDGHFHVRESNPNDIARVVRCVLGQGVGLALGGGAARGLAHIGVIQALWAKNVPIDYIGGTSAGAVTAAAVAKGWTMEEIVAQHLKVTVESGSVLDVTLPVVSLAAGKVISNGMKEGYGETEMSDLWTPCFCIAVDLATGKEMVLREGPIWQAVRASASIPGVFPPIRIGDKLCVDGGVANNLPIDHIHAIRDVGFTIAVDLGGGLKIGSKALDGSGILTGLSAMRRKGEEKPPSAAAILASLVGSVPDNIDADIIIRPNLRDIGMFEFNRYKEIIQIGYEAAIEALDGRFSKPAT